MIGAPFNGLRRAWREAREDAELAAKQRRMEEMESWLDPHGAEHRRLTERLSREDAKRLWPRP